MTDFDLTRRELIIAGVVATGYALAVRPVRADAIHTDTEGLLHGPIGIPIEGGAIAGYRARPEHATDAPVVLVVHEIFGVHEYIQDVCRRFAKLGYCAIAPDLYSRSGDPTKVADLREILRKIVSQVRDVDVMSDLDATVEWARAQHEGDADRVVVNGFCWGGRIAWLYAAHNPRLRAGLAWYGRLEGKTKRTTPRHPYDVAGELHAPVLGLYGAKDKTISAESVERMRKRLKLAGQPSRILLYGGAPHGFHADYRPSHRPRQADEAWRTALLWLHEHLS